MKCEALLPLNLRFGEIETEYLAKLRCHCLGDYRDYTRDIEDTFARRVQDIATICIQIESSDGYDFAVARHYEDGTRHPHDYKVPLNLWDSIPN